MTWRILMSRSIIMINNDDIEKQNLLILETFTIFFSDDMQTFGSINNAPFGF